MDEAYLDSFAAQTKNLFNNKSLSLDSSNYSITSVAKNALPDLTTIANVSVSEKLPTRLVEQQSMSGMMPVGTETRDTGIIDVSKVKPFRLYQRYRTIIEEGKRKSVPYGDKFMFTATKRVGNDDIVQVKSKYIFK